MANKSPKWWRSFTKEQCARLLKSNKYRAECEREHKKEAYWLQMKTTRKMMRNNGVKDLTIAGYKQEMTVCRQCHQPGNFARDCTTDIQALAQSNKPAASGEGTGFGEVAHAQPPPAKRHGRTTKRPDYSSSLSLSVNGEVAGTQAPPNKRKRRRPLSFG